jgi:hypothetical protein
MEGNTAAVHSKGSYIFLQLSPLGRTASPDVLEADGFVLVSSSVVPVSGHRSYAARAVGGRDPRMLLPIMPPRRRTPQQLASMALEIHGANGHLIDQFTQDTCNRRTDAWGASIEKRARFGLAVAKAVVEAVGPERTGIRLSPFSNSQGMRMADPIPQFGYLIEGFKKLKLAYLHVVESRISGDTDVETTETVDFAVDSWAGTSPVLIAGGLHGGEREEGGGGVCGARGGDCVWEVLYQEPGLAVSGAAWGGRWSRMIGACFTRRRVRRGISRIRSARSLRGRLLGRRWGVSWEGRVGYRGRGIEEWDA